MEIWEVADDEEQVEGLTPDGRPDPEYARGLGLVQAPIGRRVAAGVIDLVGYLVLQIPAWVLTLPLVLKLLEDRISWYGFTNHPHFVLAMVGLGVSAVASLAYCVASIALNGVRGVTLGKGLMGLRNVDVRTLERPGIGHALLRALVIWAPAVVVIGPVLVLLSPLWDPTRRGRGWQDLAGRTWMVDVRAGLNPYDEKRMRIARKTMKVAPVEERPALPSLTSPEARSAYRPAGRVSSGVLGAPRSVGADSPAAGAPQAAATPPSAPDLRGTPAGPVVRTPQIPESYQHPPTRPEPTGSGPLVLELDTGGRLELGETYLFGRGPVPTETTGDARPVAIPDTTMSVSKTHFLVRPTGEGAEVVDLSSTNGTFIVHAGLEQPLAAGVAGLARPGDTIRFGDRTMLVRRA